MKLEGIKNLNLFKDERILLNIDNTHTNIEVNNSQIMMNAWEVYNDNKNIIININIHENTVWELNFSYITYKELNLKINIKISGNNNKCHLVIHGISKQKGKSIIEINGEVKENTHHNNLDEVIKIINSSDEVNQIIPNMIIASYDALATHGAVISKFSDEDIYYLEKKGLSYKMAVGLLERGI